MNIFVYGTLMKGCYNHSAVANYVEEIHEAKTEGKLYAVGSYPGLIEEKGEVMGELLEIKSDFSQKALEELDGLEGCPNLFERKQKQVTLLNSGEIKEAWVYVYNLNNYTENKLIKSGSWKKFRETESYK